MLSDDLFFRCHKSFLVNKFHIQRIEKNKFFLLIDSTMAPISRRKRMTAKNWFLQY